MEFSATTALAIYGALVGTASLLWTIRKDFRDRGQLHIEEEIQTTIVVGAPPRPKTVRLIVTNRGRRALTLLEVGVMNSSGLSGFIRGWLFLRSFSVSSQPNDPVATIVTKNLPARLEYEDVWFGDLDWKSFYLIPYDGKVVLYAKDTLGNFAFTRRRSVSYYKDPEFENEDELPYTVDASLREQLLPPERRRKRD